MPGTTSAGACPEIQGRIGDRLKRVGECRAGVCCPESGGCPSSPHLPTDTVLSSPSVVEGTSYTFRLMGPSHQAEMWFDSDQGPLKFTLVELLEDAGGNGQ